MYRCDGTGNPDLHGRHGKIIGVDKSFSPYTVEFDDELPDAMEDRRFGGKKGHCWCCTESHLRSEKEDGGADDGSSDHRINEKGETTMAREYVKWTDEQDEKLLSMKAEGMSWDEMAVKLNMDPVQVKNRLYYLKKVKGKFGLTDKTETDTTPQPEGLTHSEEPQEEEQEGELNDLEKVLAETITEQKAEIDRLQGTVKDLEECLCKAHEENTRLYDQIGTLTEKVASLESELKDTATALEQTENQLDEEREALRNAAAELEKAKALEDDFKSMVETYAAETEKYKGMYYKLDRKYEEMSHEFTEILRGKDDRIAQMEAEDKRLTKLIIGLTEERLANHAG